MSQLHAWSCAAWWAQPHQSQPPAAQVCPAPRAEPCPGAASAHTHSQWASSSRKIGTAAHSFTGEKIHMYLFFSITVSLGTLHSFLLIHLLLWHLWRWSRTEITPIISVKSRVHQEHHGLSILSYSKTRKRGRACTSQWNTLLPFTLEGSSLNQSNTGNQTGEACTDSGELAACNKFCMVEVETGWTRSTSLLESLWVWVTKNALHAYAWRNDFKSVQILQSAGVPRSILWGGFVF